MVTTSPFDFSAGALCLDLANTWDSRPSPAGDCLQTYADLVRWALEGELLGAGEARALLSRGEADPSRARTVLGEARKLREAVYGIFSAVAGDDPVLEEHIETLNRSLARALPRLRLRPAGPCCRWEWSAPDDALDRMLWPVARSAAELLTGDETRRVGECDSPSCSWLFVDRSRNRRRRWCDMATCGNRAKARRYYGRQRQAVG